MDFWCRAVEHLSFKCSQDNSSCSPRKNEGTVTAAVFGHRISVRATISYAEQRDPKELTHANGGRGDPIAPAGIDVWNPSFDVTPADLIAGIITEKVGSPRFAYGSLTEHDSLLFESLLTASLQS